jgi:hypothetical protein
MDSKQLLRYLSNASWAVADAVLNRLQDPEAPFVVTETPAATRAAAGYLVKAPNGLIVLRTSETDTPLWNPKWLAKLTDQERASVADVLFAAQLSQLRTSLDVLALVDEQYAGTTWTLGKDNLSAKVVNRNGVKIGDVDLNGFTP